jgi:hypothetical protein
MAKVRVIVLSEGDYKDLMKLISLSANSRSKPTAAIGQDMFLTISDATTSYNISELTANG